MKRAIQNTAQENHAARRLLAVCGRVTKPVLFVVICCGLSASLAGGSTTNATTDSVQAKPCYYVVVECIDKHAVSGAYSVQAFAYANDEMARWVRTRVPGESAVCFLAPTMTGYRVVAFARRSITPAEQAEIAAHAAVLLKDGQHYSEELTRLKTELKKGPDQTPAPMPGRSSA